MIIETVSFSIKKYLREKSEFSISMSRKEENIFLDCSDLAYRVIKEKYRDSITFPDENCRVQMDSNLYKKIEDFVEEAGSLIWFEPAPYIKRLFSDTTVDYCICADLTKRDGEDTELYDAVKGIKYTSRKTTNQDYNILAENMNRILDILPVDKSDIAVTTVPVFVDKRGGRAEEEKKNRKLSRQLADYLSRRMEVQLIKANLMDEKKQAKNLSLQERADMWNSIYSRGRVIMNGAVRGKTVIIADDIYQSGTSMCFYADYLKRICGAERVIGICPIKTLKDTDNNKWI